MREPLATLQQALMQALYECRDVAEVRSRLAEVELTPELRAWVDQLDDRGVQTGRQLARQWCRIDPTKKPPTWQVDG